MLRRGIQYFCEKEEHRGQCHGVALKLPSKEFRSQLFPFFLLTDISQRFKAN